jgi:TRAP transporter 4TM/12TM fusion protein
MPPIMGAAAFLMVEYVGIPYNEVIKHAFLPAVVSYLSFLYIIHLEAVKLGLEGLPRRVAPPVWKIRLLRIGINVASIFILAAIVYYGIGWVKSVAGDAAVWILSGVALVAYLGLLSVSARVPELELDDPTSPVVELPELRPTALSGLHYLLPMVVLIWCLMIEQLSPGLSAFYATAFMIFILVTQRPLLSVFRGLGRTGPELVRGFRELKDGLETGARNMIGIGVATAAAGIVVGTVTLTGLGPVMTEFVEWLSGGSLIFMLFLIAVISLILGMGLPTTANYIVVSTLMAPVVVALGAQHGLVVPLIAVHLFVFYFGIMADVTPPVGLASFAASAISGADPIRTGVQAFIYAIRTGVLPFMFIFNTDLILYNVTNPAYGTFVFLITLLAMCLFAAGTQGFFVTRNRIYESVALILVAFTLVRPGFWMDRLVAPHEARSAEDLPAIVADLDPGSTLRLNVEFLNVDDKLIRKLVLLPLGEEPDPAVRLQGTGLETIVDGGKVIIDNVGFNSPAERAGLDFDQAILSVDVPAAQPSRYWMYLPAFGLIGLIVLLQRARRSRQPSPQGA